MYWNHLKFSQWRNANVNDGLPIGIWKNLQLVDNSWQAEAWIDMSDEFAAKIGNKIKNGVIRSASIGAQILAVSDDIKDKVKGQKGVTITSSNLMEISIVDIPANTKALAFDVVQNSLGGGEAKELELMYTATYALTDIENNIEKNNTNMDFKNLKAWCNKNLGTSFDEKTTVEDIEKAVGEFPTTESIKNEAMAAFQADLTKSVETAMTAVNAANTSKIDELTKAVGTIQADLDAVKIENEVLKATNSGLTTAKADLEGKLIAAKQAGTQQPTHVQSAPAIVEQVQKAMGTFQVAFDSKRKAK